MSSESPMTAMSPRPVDRDRTPRCDDGISTGDDGTPLRGKITLINGNTGLKYDERTPMCDDGAPMCDERTPQRDDGTSPDDNHATSLHNDTTSLCDYRTPQRDEESSQHDDGTPPCCEETSLRPEKIPQDGDGTSRHDKKTPRCNERTPRRPNRKPRRQKKTLPKGLVDYSTSPESSTPDGAAGDRFDVHKGHRRRRPYQAPSDGFSKFSSELFKFNKNNENHKTYPNEEMDLLLYTIREVLDLVESERTGTSAGFLTQLGLLVDRMSCLAETMARDYCSRSISSTLKSDFFGNLLFGTHTCSKKPDPSHYSSAKAPGDLPYGHSSSTKTSKDLRFSCPSSTKDPEDLLLSYSSIKTLRDLTSTCLSSNKTPKDPPSSYSSPTKTPGDLPPTHSFSINPPQNTDPESGSSVSPARDRILKRDKIMVPEHPNYNFIGRILGPRGISVRQLESSTGCGILIRGRGSVKNPDREERLRQRNTPGFEHLKEPLHVLITAEGINDEDAEKKLQKCRCRIQKLLKPEYDDYKRLQLAQLAMINGNYDSSRGGYIVI